VVATMLVDLGFRPQVEILDEVPLKKSGTG
jgi:hypothetical protein